MLQLCKLSNTDSKPTCLVLRTMLKHDPTFHLATVRASDSVIILRHCARYKSTYYYYYYYYYYLFIIIFLYYYYYYYYYY